MLDTKKIVSAVRCWWNTPAQNLPLPPGYRPRPSCQPTSGFVYDEDAPEPFSESAPADGDWFPDADRVELFSTYPKGEVAAKVLDQYRTLNPNPVTITAQPVQLALENRSRKEMIIVNVGVATILIAFGFSPTQSVYTMPLQACALANDGTGGIIVDQAFKGQVWAVLAAAQSVNGSILFTEIPE